MSEKTAIKCLDKGIFVKQQITWFMWMTIDFITNCFHIVKVKVKSFIQKKANQKKTDNLKKGNSLKSDSSQIAVSIYVIDETSNQSNLSKFTSLPNLRSETSNRTPKTDKTSWQKNEKIPTSLQINELEACTKAVTKKKKVDDDTSRISENIDRGRTTSSQKWMSSTETKSLDSTQLTCIAQTSSSQIEKDELDISNSDITEDVTFAEKITKNKEIDKDTLLKENHRNNDNKHTTTSQESLPSRETKCLNGAQLVRSARASRSQPEKDELDTSDSEETGPATEAIITKKIEALDVTLFKVTSNKNDNERTKSSQEWMSSRGTKSLDNAKSPCVAQVSALPSETDEIDISDSDETGHVTFTEEMTKNTEADEETFSIVTSKKNDDECETSSQEGMSSRETKMLDGARLSCATQVSELPFEKNELSNSDSYESGHVTFTGAKSRNIETDEDTLSKVISKNDDNARTKTCYKYMSSTETKSLDGTQLACIAQTSSSQSEKDELDISDSDITKYVTFAGKITRNKEKDKDTVLKITYRKDENKRTTTIQERILPRETKRLNDTPLVFSAQASRASSKKDELDTSDSEKTGPSTFTEAVITKKIEALEDTLSKNDNETTRSSQEWMSFRGKKRIDNAKSLCVAKVSTSQSEKYGISFSGSDITGFVTLTEAKAKNILANVVTVLKGKMEILKATFKSPLQIEETDILDVARKLLYSIDLDQFLQNEKIKHKIAQLRDQLHKQPDIDDLQTIQTVEQLHKSLEVDGPLVKKNKKDILRHHLRKLDIVITQNKKPGNELSVRKAASRLHDHSPCTSENIKYMIETLTGISFSDIPLADLHEKLFNLSCSGTFERDELVDFLCEPRDIITIFNANDIEQLDLKKTCLFGLECVIYGDSYNLLLQRYNAIVDGQQRSKYRLVVVTAEVFEDAMRQYQIEQYDVTSTNYFPKNCRMFLHIPVYKGGFINRRDTKDGALTR